MKSITKILLVIVFIGIVATLFSNVIILASDTSEGVPGIDMAAMWNVGSGFQWIYPGSSTNAEGHTLHNIYLDSNDPYHYAKDIIQHTYNTTPNVCVVVNNTAAERIFGDDLISNIREHDWGEGHSRGDAVSMSMGNMNIFGIFESLLSGDIRIYLI